MNDKPSKAEVAEAEAADERLSKIKVPGLAKTEPETETEPEPAK